MTEKLAVCVRCGSISCRHSQEEKLAFWNALLVKLRMDPVTWTGLVNEIMKHMTGPPLGDGRGPFQTANYLYRVHGFDLTDVEVWAVWRQELHNRERA